MHNAIVPEELRVRTRILCPHLGCTYPKQTPFGLMIRQNIFVLWPAPGAPSPLLAHFAERNRQPHRREYAQLQVHADLQLHHLVNFTNWASSKRCGPTV